MFVTWGGLNQRLQVTCIPDIVNDQLRIASIKNPCKACCWRPGISESWPCAREVVNQVFNTRSWIPGVLTESQAENAIVKCVIDFLVLRQASNQRRFAKPASAFQTTEFEAVSSNSARFAAPISALRSTYSDSTVGAMFVSGPGTA